MLIQINTKEELIKFFEDGFELLQATFSKEVVEYTYEFLTSSELSNGD